MAAPAAVYAGLVIALSGDPSLFAGWAIPAATDIAFALGALALVGSAVPLSLKVFLLTLATLDDLGAIVIIAVFYTSDLSLQQFPLAAGAVAVLAAMNRFRVDPLAPYVLVGVALWAFVLKSGVHATLAGVALAFAIPLRNRAGEPRAERLEERLHPWVTWLILPLFAFANAGVSLGGLSWGAIFDPLPAAIAAGLLIGKPAGVLLASAAAVGLGVARLPENVSWRTMGGVAALAGIGFTMSLFIGTLAFPGEAEAAGVRLGVMVGSLLSAAIGYFLLRASLRSPVGS
jgi:NhaA family Na+:H+ antiporter